MTMTTTQSVNKSFVDDDFFKEITKGIQNEKCIIILSGGMDSTTLLYGLVKNRAKVIALSFNYGQKHKKELEMAMINCKKLGVPQIILDLNVLNQVADSALTRDYINIPEGYYTDDNMKQTVVPNRNMVMLSLATSFAISNGAKYLFYGAHSGDHHIYPDCRIEFISSMKKSIGLCDWNPPILSAPFINIDKSDIALCGKKWNVDYSLTWTCYKGREKACGKCGSCIERLEAFKKIGMEDPIQYENK